MAAFVNVIDQRRLIGPGGSTVAGEIYFYYTGTNVKAPVYLDIALTIPAPNPTSVGAGQIIPQLFLDSAVTYRRVIQYSDGTYDEQDPIGEVTDQGEFGPPVGTVLDYAGDTAPSGFLFCYGQEISRIEYSDLFGVIGTFYGAGNGTTTFTLPDYRGRVLVGKDNMGGVAAGRLTTSVSPSGSILGAVGGEQSHVLTVAELPAHTHGVTDPSHTHGLTDTLRNSGGSGNTSAGGTILAASNTTEAATTGVTIQNTGDGDGHNNVQPSIVVNKIIKAIPTSFFSFSGGGAGGGIAIFQPLEVTTDGQTVFTSPVDFEVPPLVVINGSIVTSGPGSVGNNYSYTLNTITFSTGLNLEDNLFLILGVGVNQGIVDSGNVIGLTAYILNVMSSRQADVRDMAGYDPTGDNDMSSEYQDLITEAASAGVPVVAPRCKLRLGSTVALPGGHDFRGIIGPSLFTNDEAGAVFLRGHSGNLFTKGGGLGGISIKNMAVFSDQPTPAGPGWTPVDNDFDFYFPDIQDFRAERLIHMNSTRGIFMNGNRNKLIEWGGQFFREGLKVDWSYDTLEMVQHHLWPYWSQADEVRDFTQSNLKSWRLNRVDNPFFDKMFSIWHEKGFDIGWFAGDGPDKPAGTVSKMKLSNADIDIGQYAYYVQPDAIGHTARFSNFSAQSVASVANAPLLYIAGPNTRIAGDFTGSDGGANVALLKSTATDSDVSLQINSTSWNRSVLGFPAVEVEAGGGHFDILPGSKLTGGNGGAQSSGNVTVWTP